MSSYDATGYVKDLQKRALCVVEVASTPTDNNVLHSADTDPQTNFLLRAALGVYSKHYLASQEGIPGEGETINMILSRLRGEDPHVRRMTVLGLIDKQQYKVQGIAFVETYEINKVLDSGENLQGLTHLLTYAATESPHNITDTNMAFHAGILNALERITRSLGQEADDSVLVTEVNSFWGYNRKPTSGTMNDEFEIKTGLKQDYREYYTLSGKPQIIMLEGRYSYSNILQINYTPPFLAGEEGQQLPDEIQGASQLASSGNIEAASQLLAPCLKNQDAYNGRGEPLYLTAESPDGTPLTVKQLQLHKAFQEELIVSVARNFGINNRELVLAARKHKDSGFEEMDSDYNKLIEHFNLKERKYVPSTIIQSPSITKQISQSVASGL